MNGASRRFKCTDSGFFLDVSIPSVTGWMVLALFAGPFLGFRWFAGRGNSVFLAAAFVMATALAVGRRPQERGSG